MVYVFFLFFVLCFFVFLFFVFFVCSLILPLLYFVLGSFLVFALVPLFLRVVILSKHTLCVIKWSTHTLHIYILHSNKGLDVEISSSNTPLHNYVSNLKRVE